MAERIAEPQELFHHELKALLYVERTLAEEVLPELREQAHDEQLKQDVAEHLEQTKGHVRNLERAFDLLGLNPKPERSEALEGLRKAHEQGVKLIDDEHEELLDLFHASSIARSEHLEIAVYDALIEVADRTGEDVVANLLRENLEQEHEALRRAQRGIRKLLKEKISR
jgi:ferritin-like metal-binding protein YciE